MPIVATMYIIIPPNANVGGTIKPNTRKMNPKIRRNITANQPILKMPTLPFICQFRPLMIFSPIICESAENPNTMPRKTASGNKKTSGMPTIETANKAINGKKSICMAKPRPTEAHVLS